MTKPRLQPRAADVATFDSFQNFLTRTGVGAGNLNDGARYGFNPITRNRVQLEWMYRGSWVVGAVVDTVAEDMTREGVEVQSSDKPEKLQELNEAAQALQIWPQLLESLKVSRLYGGGIGYLMIDGQDPATPLRLKTIGREQFRGILPLDRWAVQPSLGDLITELGPDIGKPKFYESLPNGGTGMRPTRMHHSRCIRLEGVKLPYWQRITENHWGMSVIERMFDRLVSFDSTTAGVAQLVYKAHLRTLSVDGLREIIAAGGPALEGLAKQVDMIRKYQSSEGMTLVDAKDKFETHQYNFAGLDDVLLQFGQQLSGATGIPLVRLFGQSPAGLNSTGESDIRMYYDNVKRQQNTDLHPGVVTVYGALYRSVFGAEPPKHFAIKFKPLWQMTDEQKANVTSIVTAAVTTAVDSQVIRRSTGLKELKQLATVTGAYSNISDEEIAEAENDPAPSPEALGLEVPAANPGQEEGAGTEGGAANGSSGKSVRAAA